MSKAFAADQRFALDGDRISRLEIAP